MWLTERESVDVIEKNITTLYDAYNIICFCDSLQDMERPNFEIYKYYIQPELTREQVYIRSLILDDNVYSPLFPKGDNKDTILREIVLCKYDGNDRFAICKTDNYYYMLSYGSS
jgi:hypothetical protein